MMEKFRSNALENAKTFGVKNCAKQLVGVYEQAIQDKTDERYVTVEELRKEL